MARTLEVTLLHISERVADKIANEHGIAPARVREAIEGVGRVPFTWDNNPHRGQRAMIVTLVDDRPVLVVLYPANTGNAHEWWLGSAYHLDS